MERKSSWPFARAVLAVLAFLVTVPPAVSAQSTFAGVVRDETGSVLPGVIVEAASPALIEKTRSVVTDNQGRYRIIELRPGSYTLTFTIEGFSTFVRDNLELPANLVVTINADMKIGALQESVTVSGQTPVVDVQQAANTQVLSRTVMDALPTSRAINTYALLAPGLRHTSPDVGGSRISSTISIRGHGMPFTQTSLVIDGFSNNLYEANHPVYFNEALQSEISFTTNAMPAETAGGGYRQVSILKDGGNTMSVAAYLGGTDGGWIGTNVSEEMVGRGVRVGNKSTKIQNFNGTVGGPILKDKLWFLLGFRHASASYIPANFPNEVTLPDGSTLGADAQDYVRNLAPRLTWQATKTMKVSSYVDRYFKHYRAVSGGVDPLASTTRDAIDDAHTAIGNARWTWTPSSRWLVESGWGTAFQFIRNGPKPRDLKKPRGSPEWYRLTRKTDTALNINPECTLLTGCTTWGSPTDGRTEEARRDFKASATYVTGTHNLKFGLVYDYGPNGLKQEGPNGDLTQNYANGRPSTVTVQNTPYEAPHYVNYDIALYVQDSWTFDRLTVSPGIRGQWFQSAMREASMAAGRFVPARHYPEEASEPTWGPDWAPRFAVAYDVFGDGKTAIKGNISKYYEELTGLANRYARAGGQTDVRNWFDCDINAAGTGCSSVVLATNRDNIAQDNEIGPGTNPFFGLAPPRTPAEDYARTYTWEKTLGFQHQVGNSVSVNGTFYRRTWGNISVLDRTLISRSDYTSFQIRMPDVSRDPEVAKILDSNEILTVYNLNRAKLSSFGSDLVDRNARDDKTIYTGLEFGFNARFGSQGTVFGTWNIERNLSVFCENDDNPNGPPTSDLYLQEPLVANGGRFCDQSKFDKPFLHQIKLAGNFPLGYGVESGVVWQALPSRERVITYTIPASLFPGGRTRSETIILNEPGSLYLPRWYQLDVNVRKDFRVGRHVLTGEFGLYNALNRAGILSINDAVGSSLGRVDETWNGRTPRIGLQYRF